MLARACFILVLLACTSAWSQVDTSGTETTTDTDTTVTDTADDVQLLVPPPVSVQEYPSEFARETQSNYLRGGFTIASAYSNNISGGGGPNPVGGMSYSIWPMLALDKTTARLHLMLSYSPGFTFYPHVSAYNQSNQKLGVNLQYRLSPNLTLDLQDAFSKTSNVFDQPNLLSTMVVSGSVSTPRVAVIAPIADQLNNVTSAQLTYQIGEDGMIGATGSFSRLYYPNPEEVSGLYNSRSEGGSAFYSRRLGEKYYVGGTYQYQNMLSSQAAAPSTQTQTQTIFFFFSVYLKPRLSLSVSGGPQHYKATQSPLLTSDSWSPMTMVSLGWQGERTTLGVAYSRTVTGGGGLSGAYHSKAASASAGWQVSRTWNVGISGSYGNYQTLTPLFIQSSPGGHTISGTASAQRSLAEHWNVQLGCNWTHQSYAGIPAVSTNPNTSRAFVSINYQFTRPLQK
jgi:hypothetical protein